MPTSVGASYRPHTQMHAGTGGGMEAKQVFDRIDQVYRQSRDTEKKNSSYDDRTHILHTHTLYIRTSLYTKT